MKKSLADLLSIVLLIDNDDGGDVEDDENEIEVLALFHYKATHR